MSHIKRCYYDHRQKKAVWYDPECDSPVKGGSKKVGPGISEVRPWISQAAGCHRNQVTEFNGILQDKGIRNARYRPDGALECTTRAARNEVLRARGLRDQDAGYGDYAGS